MKFGVLVTTLEASQLAYQLIDEVNQYLEKNICDDVIVFYENLSVPCIDCKFCVMNIYEAWDFMFPCVATSLSTAAKLINFPSPSPKFFYNYDLEWSRLQQKSFSQLDAIYGNGDLILMSRSKDYSDTIRDCWNRECLTVENFDMQAISEIVRANSRVHI